jgi:hypothetical protein
MTWACELTEDAERDLRSLPKGIQKRVARTLTQMAADPFAANVKALKGDEWRRCSAVASAITAFSLPPIGGTRRSSICASCFVPKKRINDPCRVIAVNAATRQLSDPVAPISRPTVTVRHGHELQSSGCLAEDNKIRKSPEQHSPCAEFKDRESVRI